MALRDFEDSHGERWHVWETTPVRVDGLGDFQDGWLTFDNGTERRRLAPVPDGWGELPDSRLELLLRLAQTRLRRDEPPDLERRTAERRHGDRRAGHDRRRVARLTTRRARAPHRA